MKLFVTKPSLTIDDSGKMIEEIRDVEIGKINTKPIPAVTNKPYIARLKKYEWEISLIVSIISLIISVAVLVAFS